MFSSKVGRGQKMLLVGVWANRNWILGNWIKEVKARSPKKFRIFWVPTIFAGKHTWEHFAYIRLPRYGSYFFSYITIFEKYLSKDYSKFANRSVVLYPHNESEMGDLAHQAEVLNHAHSVYFFCSRDAESLIAHGLDNEKIRLAYCAVDNDCFQVNQAEQKNKTVVLASRFGPRKGLTILPEIVRELPDWNFIGLGRDWENFISESGLGELSNFRYREFNKLSRNEIFSGAEIFLSLSNLEGGPVPLIEASSLGCKVVATDTGFARDLFVNGVHGTILSNPTSSEEVIKAIKTVGEMSYVPNDKVQLLTWDRLASLTLKDHFRIITNRELSQERVK
jgi:glycosyltransferase involved in cell wall biosynthesis